MNDIFGEIPESELEESPCTEGNPFDVDDVEPVSYTRDYLPTEYYEPESDAVKIEKDIPYDEMIDALPGVAECMPDLDSDRHKARHRAITIRGLNEDIKEYTDEIKAKRLAEKANDITNAQNKFYYDVELVRIFGQYNASIEEMAAYFGVRTGTISKLMADPESDFCKVYNKAKSLLHLSIRQTQIKGALAGSERLLIHVGTHILGQRTDTPIDNKSNLQASDAKTRRKRITTLTQQIEEFDV